MAYDGRQLTKFEAQSIIEQRLGSVAHSVTVDHFDDENAIYECTVNGDQADICLNEQDASAYTENLRTHSNIFNGSLNDLFVRFNGLFVHVDGCDSETAAPFFAGEAVQ